MTDFILKRFLISIPLVFLMTFVIFMVISLQGSDFFSKMEADPSVSKRQVQELRRAAGADRPPVMRYLHWLRGVLFDFRLWRERAYLADFEDLDVAQACGLEEAGGAVWQQRDLGIAGRALAIEFPGPAACRLTLATLENPNPLRVFDYTSDAPERERLAAAGRWESWALAARPQVPIWQRWWERNRRQGEPAELGAALEESLAALRASDAAAAKAGLDRLTRVKRKSAEYWGADSFDSLEIDFENLGQQPLAFAVVIGSGTGEPAAEAAFPVELEPGRSRTWELDLAELEARGLDRTAVATIAFEGTGGRLGVDSLRLVRHESPFHLGAPNFGMSFEHRKPVFSVIGPYVRNSVFLTLAALAFTYLAAIPIGIYCAVRRYSLGDRFFAFFSYVGMALPSFFFAVLVLFLVSLLYDLPRESVFYGLLPQGGRTSEGYPDFPWWRQILDVLWHMILPTLVIGMGAMAGLQRIMRGNMLEVLRAQYIETARAKGLPENKVIYKHALRNAVNPLVAGIGSLLPALLGGSAFVEIIFNFPGIGKIMLDAVLSYDIYLVMADVLVGGLLLVIGNFVADILLVWVDPRISFN